MLVTLGCDHGTLTLSPAAGLRFISGETSAWAGEVSFGGTASFYAGLSTANGALGSMTYQPNRDWNGNDTLRVSADDRGWSTEVECSCRAGLLAFYCRCDVKASAVSVPSSLKNCDICVRRCTPSLGYSSLPHDTIPALCLPCLIHSSTPLTFLPQHDSLPLSVYLSPPSPSRHTNRQAAAIDPD